MTVSLVTAYHTAYQRVTGQSVPRSTAADAAGFAPQAAADVLKKAGTISERNIPSAVPREVLMERSLSAQLKGTQSYLEGAMRVQMIHQESLDKLRELVELHGPGNRLGELIGNHERELANLETQMQQSRERFQTVSAELAKVRETENYRRWMAEHADDKPSGK